MDAIDELILGAPDGNEPDIESQEVKALDHECLWEVERSALNRRPKFEFCLVCKKRRRIVPGEPTVFIPAPACERTNY